MFTLVTLCGESYTIPDGWDLVQVYGRTYQRTASGFVRVKR